MLGKINDRMNLYLRLVLKIAIFKMAATGYVLVFEHTIKELTLPWRTRLSEPVGHI